MCRSVVSRTSRVTLLVVCYLVSSTSGFVGPKWNAHHQADRLPPQSSPPNTAAVKTRTTTTELHMVFDFFKQRSEEGLEQLSKLSDAASKGKLGEGLSDVAEYTRVTNEAFASGLAKSRNRLLQNLEGLMTGAGGDDALEDLEDILIQADLGTATAEDIVAEVKSLREDSTTFMSRDDLLSVMRGKLIETLNVGDDSITAVDENENDDDETSFNRGAIRFSSDPKIPTILFILGANGMGK